MPFFSQPTAAAVPAAAVPWRRCRWPLSPLWSLAAATVLLTAAATESGQADETSQAAQSEQTTQSERAVQPEQAGEAVAFDDPQPQRYQLRARASELDPATKEYPEIGFVFQQDGKPQDYQHAAVDTRVPPRGRLMIWLMGNNDQLNQLVNGYGIHTIQVHYANRWFGTLCQPKPRDGQARGNVRLEAATGEDFSDELAIAKPDAMVERARQFLIWLTQENPQGQWQQFLTADQSAVRWDKVIVAGASHGSTTAARFAIHQRVDRVVMLCGPRDQDQDWQALPSQTPANRFFGFSHDLDAGWTGDHYCRSWELLRLHAFGPIVNVDDAQPPYGGSRRLISSIDMGGDANKAHSSIAPGRASPRDDNDQYRYLPVWEYLFTHPVDDVGTAVEPDPECHVAG